METSQLIPLQINWYFKTWEKNGVKSGSLENLALLRFTLLVMKKDCP